MSAEKDTDLLTEAGLPLAATEAVIIVASVAEGVPVMENAVETSIQECFAPLEDSRVVGRTRHKLMDIVTITICAVICGADYVLALKGTNPVC